MTHLARWGGQAVRWLSALFLFGLLWSCAAAVGGLPHLPMVAEAGVEMVRAGTYFHDITISTLRFLCGWVLGCCLAVPFGLITGRCKHVPSAAARVVADAWELNFHALRAIPVIALVPLAVYLGGIGELPKVCLITWGVFFPVWVATHNAASNLNASYLNTAASLGIRGSRLWSEVILPHASQGIVSGARVGLGVGLICVVAAELTGAYERGFFSQGLGFRLQRAADLGRLDLMVACLFTFAAMGLALDFVFRASYRPAIRLLFGFDPDRSYFREPDRGPG